MAFFGEILKNCEEPAGLDDEEQIHEPSIIGMWGESRERTFGTWREGGVINPGSGGR